LELSVFREDPSPVSFAITDVEWFWQNTFYYLNQLTNLNKRIEVRVIIPPQEHQVDFFVKTIEVAKQIFSENHIELILPEAADDASYDILFVYNTLITEEFLDQQMSKLRRRGIAILKPHSIYQRAEGINRVVEYSRYVHATLNGVKLKVEEYENLLDLQLEMS
jgi:hypothetical protein